MTSIFMKKNQNDITTLAVENAQQTDSAPREVARQLAEVQSQIGAAKDQRPLVFGRPDL